MISTAALILFGIAAVFVAGYGPTLLLLDRKENRSRLVVIPVLGLASYIVATHVFAGLHFAGAAATLGASIVLAALGFGVPRNRRLDRREVREALAVFAICGAGLLLAAWPLLREGYASYLAFGNPDAAFNSAINEGLLHYGYVEHQSGYPWFWPNLSVAHVFGAGYVCVLLAAVTGADVLKLHDVATAGMVFVVPSAVYLFSIVCLRASRRTALIAAAASAVSSQLCFTFFLQSFGALTFVALLPGFLAACAEALDTKGFRQTLCAALLFTGTSFGYYAAFAVMVLLLGVQAVVALAKRTIRFKELGLAAAIFAAVPLAAYPALTLSIFERSVMESGSSRLVASLSGPEVLLSFAYTLTDQFIPFFWGLTLPPLASASLFEPPAWGYLLVLGLAALLSAVLLWFLFRPRSDVRLDTRIQLIVLLAAVTYFIFRHNAYGVFKLAGWLNPVFLPFLVCGIVPGLTRSGSGKWFARCRYVVLLVLVGFNVGWAAKVGVFSLPDATGNTGKNMSGFTAQDLGGLSSLEKIVPADARILVAIPDAVVQRWVLTYLRRGNVSAVPYLNLSPDQPDVWDEVAASGADPAGFVLTWAMFRDVIPSQVERPLWHNAKFQLASVHSQKDFLMIGRGWYRIESIPESAEPWQHRFRWLRSYGDIMVLNGSGKESRLRLTIVSGFGQPSPNHSISFAINGEKFDEIQISGTANVITKPFRASGFMNRLEISLSDTAKAEPGRWALFGKWVPRDSRWLNIAISNIEMISDQEYSATRMPCRLDFSQPAVWSAPRIDGIYDDQWVAGEARVSLQPCGGPPDAVSIDGSMPGLPNTRPPFPVIVSVDGTPHTVELAKAGPFKISVPLPDAARHSLPYDIAVRTPRTFVPAELGLGPDSRRLSIRLQAIGLSHRAAEKAGRAESSLAK